MERSVFFMVYFVASFMIKRPLRDTAENIAVQVRGTNSQHVRVNGAVSAECKRRFYNNGNG
jgi:hypothetical protein